MSFSDYLKFLEPLQEQLDKVYSIASLALTVLIALWLFNFVAGLIQRAFQVGKVSGSLYRNYFHPYLRGFFSSLSSLPSGDKNIKEGSG